MRRPTALDVMCGIAAPLLLCSGCGQPDADAPPAGPPAPSARPPEAPAIPPAEPSAPSTRPAKATTPPPFDEVRGILCEKYELSGPACGEAAFESRALDLDGDGVPEWVYTILKGPLEICFVRAACFSILRKAPGGWRLLFSGMGESIALSEGRGSGYRDLIVSAANSACESNRTAFTFDGESYRPGERASCDICGQGAEGAAKGGGPSKLCAVRDEIMLE